MKAPRTIPAARPRRAGPRVGSRGIRVRVGQRRLRQDACAGAARDPSAARRRAAGKNPLPHLHQGCRRQHGRARVHDARPLGHARRRRARCRDPRRRHREPDPATAQGGARTVCLGAGDAGRAEGSDHPRAVHPAAAAISVRGQCTGSLRRARRPRPDRDDGARQPRRDARCLAGARQRDRARAAGRDGERSRRYLQGSRARGMSQPRSFHGLDRRGRQCRRRGARRCRRRSASSADDRLDDVDREIVDGPNLPRSLWQRVAAALAASSKADQAQAGRARRGDARDGYRPGRRVSRRVPDRRQDAARFGRDQRIFERRMPTLAAGSTPRSTVFRP